MAESSCEFYLAPVEFDYTALIESAGGLTVAVERCPLCSEAKRPFYCTNCVQNGNFLHSKATYPERYAEKHRKWDRLKTERDYILERFKLRIQPVRRKEEKKAAIEECRRNIELLKLALSAAKEDSKRDKKELEKSKKENYLRTAKGRKHREKKRRICDYIEKVNCAIERKGDMVARKQQELMTERQKHVHHLTTYIFDVEEVKTRRDTESMAQSDEVQEALKEASHTAYVRGRWVYADSQYKIVAPTLPCLGDYSQYNTWVATSRENQSTEAMRVQMKTPASSISAGLCYTSQLVSVLAHLLSVNLPRRQVYSEFSVSEMAEKQFNSAVSRLNQNVLYLCFSQGISPEKLEPKHTLQNIMALLSHPHLGRLGSFEVSPDMMQSVEEPGNQSEDSEEETNGNEDELDFTTDWERVPLEIPEVPGDSRQECSSTVTAVPTYQSQNLSESTLMASGYVSSVAGSVLSFFRGATGHTDKR